MKIPLSWLKEFLDIPLPSQKIAEALTLAGLEVEKIEELSPSFEGVVVATVVSIMPHPNAERLRIATVFDGKEELQIVCGAPNCRPGIKTALAKIGATLKEASGKSFKIKKSKLRDIESHGMLCSGKELGLSEDQEGILELSDSLELGLDLASLEKETIFEIGLTPNLGHCMSIIGIARELSAILSIPLKNQTYTPQETASVKITECIQLKVENQELCPLYGCRLVQNIKIGPSPDWMKKRLESVGIRSINNVVDIGNYVMLERGTPLHMFDYDTLSEKKISILPNSFYTLIKTLDGEIRFLPEQTILICDSEKPVAIAGIMGSDSSAISEKTVNVLIEAASFKSESIRKSSKQLNLRTEGAQRHEKGIDPEAVLPALHQAAALLQKYAGGEIVQGFLVQRNKPFNPLTIDLRPARVNAFLGTKLSLNEIISILNRLEISLKKENEENLTFTIPSYRNDLKLEIDLIEEIARIYGFNQIVKKAPLHLTSPLPHVPIYLFEKEMRAHLIALGLQECLTCDLISPKLAELTSENSLSHISVLHPTSIDQSILRTSLLPGLLQVIKYNQDHYQNDMKAFELGRIHFKNGTDFIEQSSIGIILTGKEMPPHWEEKSKEGDFYDLKGKVEDLLSLIGIEKAAFTPSHLHNFHPFRQAYIKIGEMTIGALGEIHPSHLHMLGIEKRLYFAELNLHDLFPLQRKEWRLKEISSYPGSERDWTLSLKEETPIALIIAAIEAHSPPHLEKIALLDLYKSPQIGKDRKNVTFRFLYRDLQKTIDLETVEREQAQLIEAVVKKLHDHIL